jgi:Uncharacterized protein conserved in bacteria
MEIKASGAQADIEKEITKLLLDIYSALEEKDYDPIEKIAGYIIHEDPTYITNHKNARSLIRKVDRDELLNIVLKFFFNEKNPNNREL